MQPRLLAYLVGRLTLLVGVSMLVPLAYALLTGDGSVRAFALAVACVLLLGGLMARPVEAELDARTALGVVTLGWAAAGVAGALPFWFAGVFSHWTDALFESVSGFTTTGATVMTNLAAQPRALLLWRSLLQWLGGMGIIVLFMSVFPRLGIGAGHLFRAEVPGPQPEKILPRVAESARVLWLIYLGLTAAAALLLRLTGLDWFDAINHALTGVATGGYSTRDAGVAAFANPWAETVLLLFMFLGGTNFFLQYRLFRFGDWRALAGNREFWVYSGLLLGAGLLIALDLHWETGAGWGTVLRMGLFQAVSIMTTTGYAVADYTLWPPLSQAVLFALMWVGGSSGSTSGGPKVVRWIVLVKHGVHELSRLLHPRAVQALRIGDRNVSERIFSAVAGFVVLYVVIWFVSVVVLAGMGLDAVTAAAAAIASLGNIGPGFGTLGPAYSFASLAPSAKLYLSFLMLVGRLEVLVVL
ncbi:MAG TPA: TrkH family potassium uptake protein, partial [Limnochordales bacterium]